MKSTLNKPSKFGKRTHTLKEILERQETTKNESTIKDALEKGSCQADKSPKRFDIKEDLPTLSPKQAVNLKSVHFDYGQSPQATSVPAGIPTSTPVSTPANLAESIHVFNGLIHKKVSSAAKLLEIDEGELKAWIDLQIEVPAKTILNLLRTIQNLHLDPLNEEIGFTQYEDGRWQVFITIEGCSKILNQHSQFNGLVFNQADTLVDGIPEWIECSIFRRDRIMPITVREYLIEVRNEKEIWKKMPRRMLRHRALQQCVRLAIAA